MFARIPHPRFLLFVAAFAIATVVISLRLPFQAALILGFDLAAVVFVLSTLPLWLGDQPDAARARAARDDGGWRLLLLTSFAVLVTVILVLVQVVKAKPAGEASYAFIAGTLLLAWLFTNLLFTFHYAHLFYDIRDGAERRGIILPEGGDPVFTDFIYFAFIIGMCCQTGDCAIASRRIRQVAVLHGFLAFLFNLGALAFTVNVLAGGV
jgi:uncharacterized membrane protein